MSIQKYNFNNAKVICDNIQANSTTITKLNCNLDQQNTYIVGPGSAYTTIQSAINQAVTDSVTNLNPKMIKISPGVYTENLVINNATGIYLSGSDYGCLGPQNYGPNGFGSQYYQSYATNRPLVTILGNITITNNAAVANSIYIQNIGINSATTAGQNSIVITSNITAAAQILVYLLNCVIYSPSSTGSCVFQGNHVASMGSFTGSVIFNNCKVISNTNKAIFNMDSTNIVIGCRLNIYAYNTYLGGSTASAINVGNGVSSNSGRLDLYTFYSYLVNIWFFGNGNNTNSSCNQTHYYSIIDNNATVKWLSGSISNSGVMIHQWFYCKFISMPTTGFTTMAEFGTMRNLTWQMIQCITDTAISVPYFTVATSYVQNIYVELIPSNNTNSLVKYTNAAGNGVYNYLFKFERSMQTTSTAQTNANAAVALYLNNTIGKCTVICKMTVTAYDNTTNDSTNGDITTSYLWDGVSTFTKIGSDIVNYQRSSTGSFGFNTSTANYIYPHVQAPAVTSYNWAMKIEYFISKGT